MAKQSQLGTANSTLASDMVLGVQGSSTPVLDRSVNSTLSFVQTATFEPLLVRTPSNALSFVQVASAARDLPIGISHTINFVSLGGRVREGTVTNTLSLNDVLIYFNYVGDRNVAGNTLNLTQTVTTLSALVVSQSLGLTDSVTYTGPLPVQNVYHYMGLTSKTSTPYRMWVADVLGLVDDARIPLPVQHVTHTLNFVHNSPIGKVWDTLNLTQTVEWGYHLEVSNTLNVTDEFEMQGLYVRAIAHDLGIGHALTWFEDTPCGKKQYTPFQGENTIPTDVTPPPNELQEPQGSISDRFALYQPPLGVKTDEVVLRAPELDNRDRNAYSRVQRETRGGHLSVYADPTWPQQRTLALTLVGLTETQVDELHTFLQSTLGQAVGLTDWEGRLWEGVVTNPQEVATQDGRDKWTISLEFEGEMLDVEQPGNDDGNGMAMDLVDEVEIEVTKWFVDDMALVDVAVGVIV